MLRRLPSLNALKAFEAAARHESFTRAAEELHVTQGAVSHQVKALEADLGFKLFNRERQRLVITDAGREYLNVIRDAFDRIALGTARLTQRQSSGVLTVNGYHDLATPFRRGSVSLPGWPAPHSVPLAGACPPPCESGPGWNSWLARLRRRRFGAGR